MFKEVNKIIDSIQEDIIFIDKVFLNPCIHHLFDKNAREEIGGEENCRSDKKMYIMELAILVVDLATRMELVVENDHFRSKSEEQVLQGRNRLIYMLDV